MTSGILTRIPLLLLPHTLAPQAMNTGTFLGTVIDPTGASIPEATVKIQRADPPFERQVTTDGTGNYIAPQVSVGAYQITFEKTGFQKVVRSNVLIPFKLSNRSTAGPHTSAPRAADSI